MGISEWTLLLLAFQVGLDAARFYLDYIGA